MIGNTREIAPNANWVALTATATLEVRDEIKATLGMENPETFETPIRRRNIYCEVVYKEDLSDEQDHLFKFLREKVTADGSGIVYVRKKKDADALCQYLQAKQMRTFAYHTDLDINARKLNQEQWMREPGSIMVSTISFGKYFSILELICINPKLPGLGIDKPNVRAIAHIGLPDDISAYFQEMGRAGTTSPPLY